MLELVLLSLWGFSILCFLLLIIAGAFRWRARRSSRRMERLKQRWQATFHQVISSGHCPDSKTLILKRRQRKDFLNYWSQVHAYVRGSGDTGMNELAAMLNMPHWLNRYLHHPMLHVQLSAITALGYFGQATPQQERFVLQALRSRHRLLSITALRCLLNLNPEQTLQQLTNQLSLMNWSDARLLSALREAPREPMLDVLEQAIATAPLRRALKCYRLAERLRGYTAQVTSDTLLQRFGQETAALAQFLRLVNTPSSRAQVLPLLTHDDADIRAQALVAIGRIGQLSDASRLLPLLNDNNAWVRYDAAATLLLLPGADENTINQWLQTLEPGSHGHLLLYSLTRTFKAGELA